MTQEEAWSEFLGEILPQHVRNEETRRAPDFEARRALFHEWVGVLQRDGHITDSDAQTLIAPKECYGPDEIALFRLSERRQKARTSSGEPELQAEGEREGL